MKELVILRTVRNGALPDGKGAFVEMETNEGAVELLFTAEDAERLIAALHQAREQIHAPTSRVPQRWETAMDPVEQQAVLRTHFSDGTREETHIPRSEIARIVRSLEQALKRFEAGAELRQ